ncbi:MAG TPA: hypothetical protein VFA92_01950 [Candidatus Binatia bacterium]|jgi:hypothetical protein|nr:hypothetical protein [Candidatus Binatia bacterium]
MHPGELARYRIDDMVRDAERYRRSAGVRTTAGPARPVRRLAGAVVSLLAWPFRR